MPPMQIDIAARDFRARNTHIQVQYYWDVDGYHIAILTEPLGDAIGNERCKPRQMVKDCKDQQEGDAMYQKVITSVLAAFAEPVTSGIVDKVVVDMRDMKPAKGN